MGENAELVAATRFAVKSASAKGIRDMMELAKPDLAVVPGQFDQHPWLFNCPNGTLDLRTGKLREHQREDYITKVCPTTFDAEAACPLWLKMLDKILPEAAVRTYVQRLCGYFLTGDVSEQILPIAYGGGNNGKTTFSEAIKGVMGTDYAIKVDKSVVIAKDREGHSTERMDLAGMRLGIVTETDDGQRFATAMMKELTGGNSIRGRRMKENTWEYKPTHKIWLETNNKPHVRETKDAAWRRLKLISFGVRIPDEEVDKGYPTKLVAEYPGILAWAVRGCLDWQRDGLAEPESVRRDTAEYRAAENVIGQYVAERCTTGAVRAKKSELVKDYQEWCEANGFHPVTSTKLTQALADDHGVKLDSGRRWYEGIGLCSDTGF